MVTAPIHSVKNDFDLGGAYSSLFAECPWFKLRETDASLSSMAELMGGLVVHLIPIH
jgi:hypothetical protein